MTEATTQMGFDRFDVPVLIFILAALLLVLIVIACCLIALRVTRREWSPDEQVRHLMEEASMEMRGRVREEGQGGMEGPPEQGAYVIRMPGDEERAGPPASRDGPAPPGQ